METMEIKGSSLAVRAELVFRCKEVFIKEVKSAGTSGAVYLPKSYVGKKIAVIIDIEGE